MNFRKDLKNGEFGEAGVNDYLNYKNYGEFYHVKKLDTYLNLSEEIRNKVAQLNGQTDLIQVVGNDIFPVEVKWDSPEKLSHNLFIEFKDVRDNGEVKITGPWRGLLKKEKIWAHFRDRKIHNETSILYMFDIPTFVKHLDANKWTYQKRTKRNVTWTTYGWLVPERTIKDVCEKEIIISDEDYERFFSLGELSATSH